MLIAVLWGILILFCLAAFQDSLIFIGFCQRRVLVCLYLPSADTWWGWEDLCWVIASRTFDLVVYHSNKLLNNLWTFLRWHFAYLSFRWAGGTHQHLFEKGHPLSVLPVISHPFRGSVVYGWGRQRQAHDSGYSQEHPQEQWSLLWTRAGTFSCLNSGCSDL